MRKILQIITGCAVVCALWACSGGHPDGVSREVADSIIALGRMDVEILSSMKPGTMEHEAQIMRILGRKHAIEAAGYPTLAREYATSAHTAVTIGDAGE